MTRPTPRCRYSNALTRRWACSLWCQLKSAWILRKSPRSAEVDATADEVRVGDEVVDTGQRLDEQQELAAVELPQHRADTSGGTLVSSCWYTRRLFSLSRTTQSIDVVVGKFGRQGSGQIGRAGSRRRHRAETVRPIRTPRRARRRARRNAVVEHAERIDVGTLWSSTRSVHHHGTSLGSTARERWPDQAGIAAHTVSTSRSSSVSADGRLMARVGPGRNPPCSRGRPGRCRATPANAGRS